MKNGITMRNGLLPFALFFCSALSVGGCGAWLCERRCHGDYGPHSQSGETGCLCRTTDYRKECRGAEDCQADCLLKRWEVVRTDGNGDTWAVPVGSCSEFEITFGCGQVLGYKADMQKPRKQPLSERELMICVD